ncbi:solute carrier family 47 member 4 isoform X3 [Eucyclogobius newberryi]|uniref:solute carrier family 47 member 4 isoform X3 n=1 Tax=Eucyclogobius newberryi TaxID=166745 RepID=UPI003B5BBEA7
MEQTLCHRIALAYREELSHIITMTGPLLFSRIFNFLLPFVMTMFCGRLGNEVMAGYGLASATINVTTAATGFGLAMACDTLTFGGKNLLRVGLILQRGILILLLFCLPCWALLINAQAILLCLGQDPEVTRIAQLYITYYLPAVPAMFLHHLQVSYLQNQGITMPQVYTALMANVANVGTNYILLYWLDLGVSGSAASNTLSQFYICVFLFAYIRWKKLYAATWEGWSVESLQEWGSYMKLAIPTTMMKCFEWWVYEIGGFLAGMLSENELAAQHAAMMVTLMTYMFSLGVQAAACARVGNALGAGDTSRAILVCKISLTLSASIALIEGVVLGSAKNVIGYIFTSDKNIIDLVAHLMNVYCFLQFFDGLVCVCMGIFVGTGKQKIPAVANLIGYYGIGLPLSVTFIFVAKMRIFGFWLGLLICVIGQSTFFIVVIFKLNWKRITEEAVKRAHMNKDVNLSQTLPDAHTPECADRLSSSQLIIRRGFTLLSAVGLFALGITIHLIVPLPDAYKISLHWLNSTHDSSNISTLTVQNYTK